jgi:hypothetical protein
MPGKVHWRFISGCYLVVLLIMSNIQVLSQRISVLRIEPLSASINSKAEELMPLVGKDGTLFFTRVFHEQNIGGKQAGSDIWSVKLTASKVTMPSNDYRIWNNKDNNSVMGMHKDGNTVYLLNAYKKEKGIAFSKRVGNEWSKPEFIPVPGLPSKGFAGYYMSPDYQCLFISMKADDSIGEEDIYVSLRGTDGEWGEPKNVGASINTEGFEISPFLASDNKTLYFASNGHGGLGDADIYMTQRLYESWDVWSKPVNLGKDINSAGFDAYFSIYDSIAFFASTRQGGLADLYKVMLGTNETKVTTSTVSRTIRFLTEPEIVELFGFIFEPVIDFDVNAETLTAKDKELLWFVANKLAKERSVKIALVGQSGSRGLLQRRYAAVSNYLSMLEVPEDRIVPDVKASEKKQPDIEFANKDSMRLLFFKEQ